VVCLPGRPEPYSNAATRNCRLFRHEQPPVVLPASLNFGVPEYEVYGILYPVLPHHHGHGRTIGTPPDAPGPRQRGPRQKVLVKRVPGHFVVTRLQTVPVREKELFYLRALLRERSATSFQDLRTVDGLPRVGLTQHSITFQLSDK